MHSLTLHNIVTIENINHPDDHQIIFDGGCITFNAKNGPLKFWFDGELLVINNKEDLNPLKERILYLKDEKLNAQISQARQDDYPTTEEKWWDHPSYG